MLVHGGYGNYGMALGILMLDSKFARIPGDVGNATTYDFPVMFKIIDGAGGDRVLNGDPTLLEPFLRGAKELEAAGCKAITTSCGFLAAFQKELAAAVSVPVFTSSLMQADLVSKMLRPDQKVGIITANAQALGEKHFAGAGIEHVPKVVIGLEETFFLDAFNSPDGSYDTDDLQREMENHAEKLVREHPESGALVFECTNMPPFAAAVQKKTGLPVFDYTTLANYVYSALVRKPFHGFL